MASNEISSAIASSPAVDGGSYDSHGCCRSRPRSCTRVQTGFARPHAVRTWVACGRVWAVWALVLLVCGGLFAVDTVRAEPPPAGFDTPRAAALGTGLRASSVSTAALAQNPSGLGIGSLYHLEGVMGYLPAQDVMALQAGVVDSQTSRLGAGLGMRGYIPTGADGFSGIDARLGFGFPITDAFALGIGGRYVSFESDFTTAEGNTGRRDLAKGFTVDVAARLSPMPGLHLTALGQNLINLHSPYAPLLLGGGAAFSMGELFTLGGDVLVDMTTFDSAKLIMGAGLELLAAGIVPLRAGYQFDMGREVHMVTAGLGYIHQAIGIDLSLRQGVAGSKATELMAAIRYFVQ